MRYFVHVLFSGRNLAVRIEQPSPCQHQIHQAEQREQLGTVPGQSPVARLFVVEKMPLIAFFGLVHFAIPLAALVLGRGRGTDRLFFADGTYHCQSSVHHTTSTTHALIRAIRFTPTPMTVWRCDREPPERHSTLGEAIQRFDSACISSGLPRCYIPRNDTLFKALLGMGVSRISTH